jgi:hypothetical protein
MGDEYNVETDIINVNERKLDDLKRNYNNFKKQMINLDNQNNLVSSVNKFNDKKMGITQKQLSSLEKDLGTVRRQAEISQNSSLKKEDYIDMLRALFGILAIITLITMFFKGNAYYQYFVGIVAVVGVSYILKLLFGFYNRDPNRWNVTQWKTDIYGMIDPQEEIDECLGDLDEGLNDADTALKNKILTDIIKVRNANEQIDNAEKTSADRIKVLSDRKNQIAELIKTNKESLNKK